MKKNKKIKPHISSGTIIKKAVLFTMVFAMTFIFLGCGARIDLQGDTQSTTTTTTTNQSEVSGTTETSAVTTTPSSSQTATTDEPTSSVGTTQPETQTTTKAPTSKPTSAPTSAYTGTVTQAQGKVIAFTFDDGPNNSTSDGASTKMILDKLESLGMKATFFVVGHRLSNSSKTNLQRMIDLGCDIGNHSYDHPNFNTKSLSEVKTELEKTNKLVKDLVGYTPFLMRPPYGNLKRDYAKELGMTVICWDVDTMDWDFYSKNSKTKSSDEIADMIYDYTLTKIYSSSKIVLMHDIYPSTAKAFCKLADKLVADGYTLVSISELLGSENIKNTTTYYGFDKWPS